jgi:hypothetical protein
MSVDQTKNIKNTAATEERTPRSIRLTKAHREDIVNAVMQRWEAVNPCPTTENAAKDALFAAIAKKYRQPSKSTAPELRAFSKILTATTELTKLLGSLSEEAKKCFEVNTSATWRISAVDDLGNSRHVTAYSLPVKMAEHLELPYYSATEEGHATFPVPNRRYNMTIAIPQNSEEYRTFIKAGEVARDWAKEKAAQCQEVTDYLEQFNTTNQIREAWPELIQYLPAHLADPERVIKLPALAKSRLNERLGL